MSDLKGGHYQLFDRGSSKVARVLALLYWSHAFGNAVFMCWARQKAIGHSYGDLPFVLPGYVGWYSRVTLAWAFWFCNTRLIPKVPRQISKKGRFLTNR